MVTKRITRSHDLRSDAHYLIPTPPSVATQVPSQLLALLLAVVAADTGEAGAALGGADAGDVGRPTEAVEPERLVLHHHALHLARRELAVELRALVRQVVHVVLDGVGAAVNTGAPHLAAGVERWAAGDEGAGGGMSTGGFPLASPDRYLLHDPADVDTGEDVLRGYIVRRRVGHVVTTDLDAVNVVVDLGLAAAL